MTVCIVKSEAAVHVSAISIFLKFCVGSFCVLYSLNQNSLLGKYVQETIQVWKKLQEMLLLIHVVSDISVCSLVGESTGRCDLLFCGPMCCLL